MAMTAANSVIDDFYSWIAAHPCTVPFPIVSSSSGRSILLSSDGADKPTASTTFSISLTAPAKTLWISEPIPSSTPNPHLLLLLQLLHDAVAISHALLPKPDPARLPHALDPSPDSSALLYLALLCHLFRLCTGDDAPVEAGLLFFSSLDAALAAALKCRRSLGAFLFAVGADREERFMRSVGHMVAKWCIIGELSACREKRPFPAGNCLAYAMEAHGMLIMKAYVPIPAMSRSRGGGPSSAVGAPKLDPKEAALRYALAHQQLEFVAQLEYHVCGLDPRFLQITLRVDNIRVHVARLGSGGSQPEDGGDVERHFVSRVRVLVGPAAGLGYAIGPSLGRSTGNPERAVEATRTVKGGFGFQKGGQGAGVRAKARWSVRARQRSWRWEQEAEGSAAVFDGVLCDAETGAEVAGGDLKAGMRRRYSGAGRVFSKSGGLVVAGDELPEAVRWRVGREMEGERVRWRIGGKVLVSYLPNEVRSGYFETRWAEWEEEAELTLAAGVNVGR